MDLFRYLTIIPSYITKPNDLPFMLLVRIPTLSPFASTLYPSLSRYPILTYVSVCQSAITECGFILGYYSYLSVLQQQNVFISLFPLISFFLLRTHLSTSCSDCLLVISASAIVFFVISTTYLPARKRTMHRRYPSISCSSGAVPLVYARMAMTHV